MFENDCFGKIYRKGMVSAAKYFVSHMKSHLYLFLEV